MFGLKNFNLCWWGAERRVKCAQTQRGPPSAWAEISFIFFFFLACVPNIPEGVVVGIQNKILVSQWWQRTILDQIILCLFLHNITINTIQLKTCQSVCLNPIRPGPPYPLHERGHQMENLKVTPKKSKSYFLKNCINY